MSGLQWNKEFAQEQSGDDPELLAELLTLLDDASQEDLARIKAGMAVNDGEAVADAAHSIKGAAASLGVEGFRVIAYDFEKKGRTGQLAEIDIAILESLVDQLGTLKV